MSIASPCLYRDRESVSVPRPGVRVKRWRPCRGRKPVSALRPGSPVRAEAGSLCLRRGREHASAPRPGVRVRAETGSLWSRRGRMSVSAPMPGTRVHAEAGCPCQRRDRSPLSAPRPGAHVCAETGGLCPHRGREPVSTLRLGVRARAEAGNPNSSRAQRRSCGNVNIAASIITIVLPYGWLSETVPFNGKWFSNSISILRCSCVPLPPHRVPDSLYVTEGIPSCAFSLEGIQKCLHRGQRSHRT
eukprot:g46878.t1